MPQKTKYEILKESVEYYAADPLNRRSEKQGDCVYTPPDTQTEGCAVSRCVQPEKKPRLDDEWGDRAIENIGSDTLEVYLQPAYRGHPLIFWRDLQELHDFNAHWTKDSLSKGGYKMALMMCEKYDEDRDHSWLQEHVDTLNESLPLVYTNKPGL